MKSISGRQIDVFRLGNVSCMHWGRKTAEEIGEIELQEKWEMEEDLNVGFLHGER
jgi:hypothetical protein